MYDSYCGWYTTRIEDRSVVDNSTLPPRYPVFAAVAYSNVPGYEHVMSSISDSAGRVITVHSCQWQTEPSVPPADPAGDDIRCVDFTAHPEIPHDIHAVGITSIVFPAFGTSVNLTGDIATYRFVYELSQVKRGLSL